MGISHEPLIPSTVLESIENITAAIRVLAEFAQWHNSESKLAGSRYDKSRGLDKDFRDTLYRQGLKACRRHRHSE